MLANPEHNDVVLPCGVLHRIAGFAHEIGNVDFRQRVRALDDQQIACGEPFQRLAGAQRGQGALQAAQVEGGLAHGRFASIA